MQKLTKTLHAAFEKSEEQPDGTIKVYGWASSETVDSDGEIITAAAMKAALPDYLRWGAVREMHQPKAAGTALEARVQPDGRTYFAAHVVDAEAVKKVKAGVYKGFSIGGKVTARDELNKSTITGLELVEVSLVDRPANPAAKFECYKAEMLEDAAPTADVTPEAVNKSMYSVSEAAEITGKLWEFANYLKFQASAEQKKDMSPAALELAKQMSDLLGKLTDEERAVIKNAAAEELAKRGQKYSKSTKARLDKIHKSLRDCDKELSEMGYQDAEPSDDEEHNEPADKVAKAETLSEDDQAVVNALLKAASITSGTTGAEILKAATAKIEALNKRVAELESQPAPPKGFANGVAVSKSEDVLAGQPDPNAVKPIYKNDGTVDELATLMKAAQSTPVTIYK